MTKIDTTELAHVTGGSLSSIRPSTGPTFPRPEDILRPPMPKPQQPFQPLGPFYPPPTNIA